MNLLLPCGVDDLSEERLRGLWEGQEELVDVINAMCGGETSYVHTNFSDEPFRRAALMFREKRYHGIIELLSEAIERGAYSSCVQFETF